VKVAISSSSFAHTFAAGEGTQLEWLERCASELALDGVVFDAAHFPRTDVEYVAQLRKIAVDLGLVPVALASDALFDPTTDDATRRALITLAAGLGTLFVLTRLPLPGDVPPATFVAAVAAAKATAKIAKAANVTVLIMPQAGTIGADIAGVRHFLKDVDSAWMRFALPARGLDRAALGGRDRVLLVDVAATDEPAALADIDEAARPWLLAEIGPSGEPFAAARARVTALREAAAEKLIATSTTRAVCKPGENLHLAGGCGPGA
jgi:hypothetical protein